MARRGRGARHGQLPNRLATKDAVKSRPPARQVITSVLIKAGSNCLGPITVSEDYGLLTAGDRLL